MKRKTVLLGILALAVVVLGVLYFVNPSSLQGFMRKASNEQKSTTASADDEKWWCMSQEEWNEKWGGDWSEDPEEGEEPIDIEEGSGEGESSGGGTSQGEGSGETSEGESSLIGKLPAGTMVSPPSDWIEILITRGLDGKDGGVTIPGGGGGGGILEGGGGTGTPGVVVPDLPEDPGSPSVDEGGEGGGVEVEKGWVGYKCECNDTRVFVEEFGKFYACPAKGDGLFDENDEYTLWISTNMEYECSRKWQCDEGSVTDWEELFDTCRGAKQRECGVGGKAVSAEVLEACEAFVPSVMDSECVSKEACEESNEYYDKYYELGTYTEEILKAGLPHGSQCEELYGYQDGWFKK
ncbi:MAG: hypothetical protein U1C56_02055 [Candidatus Curtissbacteria bacterium]|nr:hypothetical protein [Candidatus Curtissbacteria bacterium]